MNVTIHSNTHVEITDGDICIALEYDAAGDFVDAVMAEPERINEFAQIAIASEEG